MSSAPGFEISRSLALAAALRETTARFAKKEDLLTRDLAARRVAIQRKHREAVDKAHGWAASQSAQLEAAADAERKRVRAIYEHRKTRVERLHSTGLRHLPRRAQETKARWLGDLQMRHFRAERALATGLQTADAELAVHASELAELRGSLAALQRLARRYFRGYWTLLRLRGTTADAPAGDAREDLVAAVRAHLATAEERLVAFRRFALPRLFTYAPLPLLIALLLLAGTWFAWRAGWSETAEIQAGGLALGLIGALAFIHRQSLRTARSVAASAADALSAARLALAQVQDATQSAHAQSRAQVQQEFDDTAAEIGAQWHRADEIEGEFENTARRKLETQAPRLTARLAAAETPKLARLEAETATRREEFHRESHERTQRAEAIREEELAEVAREESERWTALEADWQREISPLYESLATMSDALETSFPPWSARLVETWTPPAAFTPATLFGRLAFDLSADAPTDPRLSLPGSPQVGVPLALTFPDHGSLLFETHDSGPAAVLATMDNLILRLLATTPPGKLAFTIIDPIGLGQSFAGLMHLADYEESLINRRIWTQREQIDERLAELSAHIEKVIQRYLRNEYATITEYNAQAGSVAEKYHFLIVADFPAGFSETAAKRLQSIATSGARCGIFTMIHWDQRQPLPDGFSPDELRQNSLRVRRENGAFFLSKEQALSGATLVFDPPPEPELAVALVHKIGKASIDSNRVEVPFVQISPAPAERWTHGTTSELRVAIGRTGATKLQYLAIGKGTRQHALFAGKTGSGKSTLFHVIITNLALGCSPDEVEFYLIDFKKGVEFKCYAEKRLPHARVIAIESDREFALSVLQRVDQELKRRGDLFRALGVQDLAGYKRAGGGEPMPRSLLLIDEFQEFFVEDDTIAQSASLLFDRIVRQGRAFGIHVLLGSQSLGGAYSLARATLGQMVIRVALQCNEADAYLIMDDTNSAPRLLTRPGEGIYNDAGGAIEGNSPFQVVWLPDEERNRWLDEVQALAKQAGKRFPSPVVFEGNAPADLRENDLLRTALETKPSAAPTIARCWLGAPNAIKGPTEASFQRQSGNHLLIVGQREEASLSMLGLSLLALAAQFPVGTARFLFLASAAPGTPDEQFLASIAAAIPHPVKLVHIHEIGAVIGELAMELKARSSGEIAAETPATFLFIHGVQKFKKLRQEEDFSFSMSDAEPSAGAQLAEIISEGSSFGIHVLASVDTFNNVNRSISRKSLSEFEMRVVFQMSANDSASLIDSPRASTLGLHRALFYNEHEGTLETFRPYALPDARWLAERS